MKSPKPRNKAQRKFDYKNYDAIIMRKNYYTKLSASKLSGEIMTVNYQLVYYVAENVGIIGILAYSTIGYVEFVKNYCFILICALKKIRFSNKIHCRSVAY